MGWIKADGKDNHPAAKQDQSVDEVTKIRKITLNPEGYRYGECLRQNLGRTVKEALWKRLAYKHKIS